MKAGLGSGVNAPPMWTPSVCSILPSDAVVNRPPLVRACCLTPGRSKTENLPVCWICGADGILSFQFSFVRLRVSRPRALSARFRCVGSAAATGHPHAYSVHKVLVELVN